VFIGAKYSMYEYNSVKYLDIHRFVKQVHIHSLLKKQTRISVRYRDILLWQTQSI